MTDGKRPFISKSNKPINETLKSVLIDVYPYYEELMRITKDFNHDWNFSKSSGWMLKIHSKNKALFYLIPLENSMRISLAIRENEREVFMKDPDLEIFQNMFESARKYREGYSLVFMVTDRDVHEKFKSFLNKLILLR